MTIKANKDVKENYIEPIFRALEAAEASDDCFEKIVYDCKDYFEYLPDRIKAKESFVRMCIFDRTINYSQIPQKFKNNTFITKEIYNFMLSRNLIGLNENLYPQSKELVVSACQGNTVNFEYIESQFKTKQIIIDCLAVNNELVRKEEVKAVLSEIKDTDRFKDELRKNPSLFKLLSEDQKKDSEYLHIMLDNKFGYIMCKNHLRRNTDPQIALKALKVPGGMKEINQKFIEIIKNNNASKNAYLFFKAYLEKVELENLLQEKDNQVGVNKKVKL